MFGLKSLTASLIVGVMSLLLATSAAAQVFTQNFDGVTAPALPAGWTISGTGTGADWVTSATTPDTAPNCIFTNDVAGVSDRLIVSPTIALPAGTNTITFRNNYDTESTFDGGVLEISIAAAAFTDFVTAGGTFTTGGYNGVISVNFSSPILGRNAWTGTSGGYITTTGTLPAGASGQNIQLRWRMACDTSVAGIGWRVDGIVITGTAPVGPEMDVSRIGAVANNGTDTVTGAAAGTASVLTYTITNSGTAALTITLPIAAPGALTNCTASITTSPAASVASGGGTTTLGVSVTPAAAGLFSCTITIANNDANENPYNWTISGTATGPAPEMDVTRGATPVADGAATDPLGGVPFGAAQTVTYTITNSGTAGLNLTGAPTLVVVTAVLNVTSVTVTTQPAASIAAAGTTTFVVTYTATAAGVFSFTVSIANNDANENPYNWTADGTGTSAPEIGIARGAAIVDGGTDAAGNAVIAAATTLTYTISNTGNAALTITNPVTIAGLVNCVATVTTAPAASVAAAGTTTLVISVTPTAAGAFSFTVSAVNNDANENPYNWTVNGTGTATGGATAGGGGGGGGCIASGTQPGWYALSALALFALLLLAHKLRRAA